MNVVAPLTSTAADRRRAAFANPSGPEVFTSVVHGNQIWTPDPFDVESIHPEAREMFAKLVNRAFAAPPPTCGKTLLLLGEAGSGKTHLLRAFRNKVHADSSGYCGYVQMTTRADNYARYILANLIDSLEEPYLPGKPSGLARLAIGLLDALEPIPKSDRDRFRTDIDLQGAELAGMVDRFADMAVQIEPFKQLDIDVIRGLLWLLPDDNRIHPRAVKWLRCEDLSQHDRELLGGLVPRPQEEAPLRTIVSLGRVMSAVDQSALVIFVDQLEESLTGDAKDDENRGTSFRLGVNTLIDIADSVPTAVVVIACLEDFFVQARHLLSKPKLDRLENDPAPIRLSSRRSVDDVRQMVARRLIPFFEAVGAVPHDDDPIAPLTDAHLKPLTVMRPRDILNFLRTHHDECIRRGQWFEPSGASLEPTPTSQPSLNWEQRWNDFAVARATPVDQDEAQLAALLGWAIQRASAEMPPGLHFETSVFERFVETEIHLPDNTHRKRFVALCEKKAVGGGLGKQIKDVAARAGTIPAVLVRTTPFPSNPKTEVGKQILALIHPRGNGLRVVIENSDLRKMESLRAFSEQFEMMEGFDQWQRESKPLSQLAALRRILDFDALLAIRPAPATAAARVPPAGAPKSSVAQASPEPPPSTPTGEIVLGRLRSAVSTTVGLDPNELCQHIAFLGGSGSGKTTAALNIIEQLLVHGVPAVLLDRKGDLCRYADPAAWSAVKDDSRTKDRAELRERLNVTLYTPGNADGRPLALPVVPLGLEQLAAAEREQLAGYAAAALGKMMEFRGRGQDPRLAILGKAIDVLARQPGKQVSLAALRQLIADQDDDLLIEVDGFDDKHFRKLAENLLTLSLTRKSLFDVGPPLDIDELLGRGAAARPGKTQLSIISTQFLGDPTVTDFWVAQFLVAVGRWASKNPADRLQAVFMFDEADQYLPAMRQPSSKAPMEHLLKRARSAGVGVFLATQSPGDFDYKCRDQIRTWLIGRVKEPVAINKLRPMLEAGRLDAAAKLPRQGTGEFYLARESEVIAVRTDPSLISTRQVPEDQIVELACSSSA